MKLKNGAIGTFNYGSAFGPADKTRQFTIYGDKGSVDFNFSPALPKPVVKVQIEGKDAEVIEIDDSDDSNGIVTEFKNFYEAVKANDKSLLISKPDVTFHHLAIIDAALKSSANGGSAVKVESAL